MDNGAVQPAATVARPAVGRAPSLGVVVLNWNGGKTVSRCIDSVMDQLAEGDELVLVDNASTDGSTAHLIDIARARPDIAKFLQNATNLGFAAGMNVGFRATRTDLVIFANQDIVFAPDFVASLKALAVRCPDIAMFSPAVYEYGSGFSREKPFESGVSGTGLFYRPRFTATGGATREAMLAYGCCMIGRVSALEALVIEDQLFEEAFHSGYEDMDLQFRLHNFGGRLRHDPALKVEHLGSGSVDNKVRIFDKPAWYQKQLYRNRWLWVLLNERALRLALRAPLVIGYELIVLGYLAAFHARSVPLYLQGVAESFTALRAITARRRAAAAAKRG